MEDAPRPQAWWQEGRGLGCGGGEAAIRKPEKLIATWVFSTQERGGIFMPSKEAHLQRFYRWLKIYSTLRNMIFSWASGEETFKSFTTYLTISPHAKPLSYKFCSQKIIILKVTQNLSHSSNHDRRPTFSERRMCNNVSDKVESSYNWNFLGGK